MNDPNIFGWHSIGGLGEVGMNCMVFQFGKTIVPVDAGVLFADQNDFGVEALFPDFTSIVRSLAPKVWFITHAHEDHIGAVPYLLQKYEELGVELPKIYASGYAAALIKDRLRDSEKIKSGGRFLSQIVCFDSSSVIHIDDVEIRPVSIRHSTPDAFSLAITWRNPKGQELRIVHSADFKIDTKKFEDGAWGLDSFDVFGGAKLDMLFVDSTNAEREGHSVSETEIFSGLEKLVAESTGRVYVTLFSSNVHRIAALLKIAKKTNRIACLAGRSLQTAYRLATEEGIFTKECPDFSGVQVLDVNEINQRPPEKQLIICSGSQGEFRSVLMRLASAQHPNLVLEPNDSVIFSSKTIPGNEKSISRIINALLRSGANVYHGEWAKIHAGGPIHASGHARRGEIALLMNYLKPEHIVPVHGELRQLMSCCDVALQEGVNWGLKQDNVHVVENGMQLQFYYEKFGWALKDKFLLEPQARMLRFENMLSPSRDPFLKVRKRAALGGVVTGVLDSQGQASVRAFGLGPESFFVDVEALGCWLASQYPSLKRNRAFVGDTKDVEDQLSEECARYVRRLTGVRPFVSLHLVNV